MLISLSPKKQTLTDADEKMLLALKNHKYCFDINTFINKLNHVCKPGKTQIKTHLPLPLNYQSSSPLLYMLGCI